ncbi:molybdopterin-guanine dinucleotide biosynthesis protein B [Zobellella maritima]|uniref:molybdopterin-guanine dinucleotide biosynthesis protein B n=1 Tax=Zobellella maritima TaxID=2059725 RepID=UPI000E307EFD|nr:molybdopterin-guanine dinucleotide biosynthesis protein B [Zobellella maritima]
MSPSPTRCSLLGFAGFSGSGKTSLLRQLLPLLRHHGLTVGVVKHTHHDVEQDTPGKDSYELRHAGAAQCLLAGPNRSILTFENLHPEEPNLNESLSRLDLNALDLVLVEGFREAAIPKIEIHRPVHGKPLLCLQDPWIVAVASDHPELPISCPLLDLNQPHQIADFILQQHAQDRLQQVKS